MEGQVAYPEFGGWIGRPDSAWRLPTGSDRHCITEGRTTTESGLSPRLHLSTRDCPSSICRNPVHQLTANETGTIEKGRFRSMDVDVFEATDGRLLVNELQTVFG